MFVEKLKKLLEAFTPRRFDSIQVEVSALCNASCPYCVHDCYKDQWEGGLMDMQTFHHLQPSFGMAHLVFLQGWGEPLLHPRFWEMVKRVKASEARVGYTTNGTRLDAEALSKTLDTGVDIMGLSLAGVTPAMHERFRKGCGFQRIDTALRELKEMKRSQQRKGPDVHLAFMLLHSNWQELAQLPDLAHQWGVSQIVVSNLYLIGTQTMQEESLLRHPELFSRLRDTLESTKEIAAQKDIGLHYDMPDLLKPCPVCKENVLRSCFVSYQGDVSPCVVTNLNVKDGASLTHYFEGRAYHLQKYIFGNVNERSLQEIWTSSEARQFRENFQRRLSMEEPGTSHLEAPCQQCYKLLER